MSTDSSVDALFLSFQEAVVGRYSLERELGRGGMGVVYLAREVRLDRPVAIKLLPPEMAAQPRLRDRFLREARLAARLSHPYIVPIHAVDEVGDFVFYVMAYVDGETLAQRVAERGPLPPSAATRVLREVAWALAYAHAQGVVHRDVKPANILLERGTERAMVTDFGIARLTESGGETALGELLGTPEYMSPEQASGEPVDGRSDLYALGAVGYYALTGRPPFTAPTTQAILAQQITKDAPPVTSAARGVPGQLARAIDQCLEKDPARRFATGEALADALAPSLEAREEIPVPLRVFLDRRRMGVLISPPLVFIGVVMPMLGRIGGPGTALSIVLGATAIGASVGILLARLRGVLRHGYGPDDIAAALRTRFDRRREEFYYQFGTAPSLRERAFNVLAITGLGLAGALTVSGSLLLLPGRVVGPAVAASLYLSAITGIASGRWRRLRKGKGPGWARFWQGRIGRFLSRIAGTGLRASRVAPANRPTELAIAMSAEGLFSSFPRALRESLGDVPAVLRNLEAHAKHARARIEELDAAIAQAQHGPRATGSEERQAALVADLQKERAKAERRLADVVTALENVRLDLLRLHAGAGSTESITQDLASARALGEDADRLIAGVKEVEAALGRTTG